MAEPSQAKANRRVVAAAKRPERQLVKVPTQKHVTKSDLKIHTKKAADDDKRTRKRRSKVKPNPWRQFVGSDEELRELEMENLNSPRADEEPKIRPSFVPKLWDDFDVDKGPINYNSKTKLIRAKVAVIKNNLQEWSEAGVPPRTHISKLENKDATPKSPRVVKNPLGAVTSWKSCPVSQDRDKPRVEGYSIEISPASKSKFEDKSMVFATKALARANGTLVDTKSSDVLSASKPALAKSLPAKVLPRITGTASKRTSSPAVGSKTVVRAATPALPDIAGSHQDRGSVFDRLYNESRRPTDRVSCEKANKQAGKQHPTDLRPKTPDQPAARPAVSKTKRPFTTGGLQVESKTRSHTLAAKRSLTPALQPTHEKGNKQLYAQPGKPVQGSNTYTVINVIANNNGTRKSDGMLEVGKNKPREPRKECWGKEQTRGGSVKQETKIPRAASQAANHHGDKARARTGLAESQGADRYLPCAWSSPDLQVKPFKTGAIAAVKHAGKLPTRPPHKEGARKGGALLHGFEILRAASKSTNSHLHRKSDSGAVLASMDKLRTIATAWRERRIFEIKEPLTNPEIMAKLQGLSYDAPIVLILSEKSSTKPQTKSEGLVPEEAGKIKESDFAKLLFFDAATESGASVDEKLRQWRKHVSKMPPASIFEAVQRYQDLRN